MLESPEIFDTLITSFNNPNGVEDISRIDMESSHSSYKRSKENNKQCHSAIQMISEQMLDSSFLFLGTRCLSKIYETGNNIVQNAIDHQFYPSIKVSSEWNQQNVEWILNEDESLTSNLFSQIKCKYNPQSTLEIFYRVGSLMELIFWY